MSKDDLTRIKGVGVHKARLLTENGYTTFEDVYRAKRGKIASIPSFGDYNERMIKESVMDFVHDQELSQKELEPVWNRKLNKVKKRLIVGRNAVRSKARKINANYKKDFDKLINQIIRISDGKKMDLKEKSVKEIKSVSKMLKNLSENPSKKDVAKVLDKVHSTRKAIKALKKKKK